MRTVKLENIAEIFSGLVLNRFICEDGQKKYKTVTLKSVDDNTIEEDKFEIIKVEREIDTRYILKTGDILFKLSPPYSVVEIEAELENVIVPSNFAIIRVKDKKIIPKYLSFLMNSRQFKNSLKKQSEGSNLAVMKLGTIKELEFILKPFSEQKEFCEFISLLLKKEKLRKRVAELEENFKECILENIQNNNIKF